MTPVHKQILINYSVKHVDVRQELVALFKYLIEKIQAWIDVR